MKIYAIATNTRETYGHGDYGDEQRIIREGSYGSCPFPPTFKTREAAERHFASIKWNADMQVVELELRD